MHYGGDAGGTRFSLADQITPENVDRLEIAWTYRTGDLIAGRTTFQATPLFANRTLYVITSFGRVVAVDPAQGYELWSYDPAIDVHATYGDYASRGVGYWPGPSTDEAAWDMAGTPDTCVRRIFVAPVDARLIALDADTGLPCDEFADRGVVDLKTDLVNTPEQEHYNEYGTTSPPVVISDLVIVGSSVADNQRHDAPSGVVRAFSARTGALRWAWDPIPREDTAPHADDWRGPYARVTGAANVWTVMSADPDRGLLFVPTGSASPDFFGGERLGDNRSANSLVALRVSTGAVVWEFQAVHHDVWDYDLPAPPVLATVSQNGTEVPVVAQLTKIGFTYVLHRETGQPIFPIEERPVPQSDIPGEVSSPTQPFPTRPEPIAASGLDVDDLWGVNEADREWCLDFFTPFRSEGIFTPPSLVGSVVFPGNGGGANWSGGAFDPTRRILVASANNMPTVVRLIPREDYADLAPVLRRQGWEVSPQAGTAYAEARSFPRAPSGLLCNPPPWGTLTAVDLDNGATRWQVPLGAMADPADIPQSTQWGSLNFGGPIVTATGLVFIAGTVDAHLRAFDISTGRELWAGALPAGGHATPMSYALDDRQYVVIAAGGHARMPSPAGDYLVAFALPNPDAEAGRGLMAEDIGGRYSGYLRVEGEQHEVAAELGVADASTVSGQLRADSLGLDATVRGRVSAESIELDTPFTATTPECTGTITGTLTAPGPVSRLTGGILVSSDCSGDDPETGRLQLQKSVLGR